MYHDIGFTITPFCAEGPKKQDAQPKKNKEKSNFIPRNDEDEKRK
jgi:hypothetical protein